MMPPMDKPMDEKDMKVKCPACGEMLSLEKAADDMKEDKPMGMEKPMDKKPSMPGERADNMPMDRLKNVLMSAKPKPEPQGL